MRIEEEIAARYERAADLDAARVADEYHRLFYDTERMAAVTWRGLECWKYPTDLIVYAEILHEIQPAVLIETGTFLGGSALFFAEHMDGRVVSIDVRDDDPSRPWARHPRISYVAGSSIDPEIVARVQAVVNHLAGPVMVVLDSDHSRGHVLAELDAYAPMVSRGSFLVVEDTNINGHPVIPDFGPGPAEALAEWLPRHREFEADRHCERLLLTANPGGWLRKIR